jgi:DNA ligase (NAD+)
MKGISKATIEKLIDWGWVSCPTDIFELVQYKNEWIQKPGFGIKSVEKVFNAVAASANCELHQFIAALGIPLIGTTASKELAKHFDSWNNFIEAVENRYAFYELPNFGVEMHRNLINFNYAEAKLLAEHYITFKTADRSGTPAAATLEGKVFVITGKLSHFKNRDAIKDKIESLGGKVSGSVSKNTDYLITNEASGSSKYKKAVELNIPIITEDEFLKMIGE